MQVFVEISLIYDGTINLINMPREGREIHVHTFSSHDELWNVIFTVVHKTSKYYEISFIHFLKCESFPGS